MVMDTVPTHELDLDGCTLRVEPNDLGLTVVGPDGNTVCYLNAIGTATLKEWLNRDFDPAGRWLEHQSVKELLATAAA